MADFRIYVACLAAYNSGRLHGVWIDCNGKDAEDLQADISAMLAASPEPDAEEWAIHDYECSDGIRPLMSEYMGLDKVALAAELADLEDEGGHYAAGLRLALERQSGKYDAADVKAWIDDHYAGESDFGPAGWCEQFMEDTGGLEGVPENLRYYFDWEAYARDVACSDVDFVDSEGEYVPHDRHEQCYAFHNH